MRKTKLLTSLAALALVLGLGACEVTDDDVAPDESGEVTTTDTDTGSGDEGGTPSEGGNEDEERYFLGLEVSEVNYYFDGTVYNSYYGNANKDISKAVPITVAEYGTGYSLSFVDADGATQYIYMDENEGHHNFKWSESGIYAWDYDETFDTLTTTGSDGTVYFIGCYGTYAEFSLNEYGYLSGDKESSYTQYPAHLYEIPEDWTPYEEPEIDEDELTTVKTGKLGLFQESLNYYYYFTGKKSGNFGATTTEWDEAVEVTLLTDNTYYFIRFVSDEETLYFGHTNSSNQQVAFNSDPYPLQYDETYQAYLNTDGTRYLGTYSNTSNDYSTLCWSEVSYLGGDKQYIATIYESAQEQPEHEPEPELPERAITTTINCDAVMNHEDFSSHTWATNKNTQDCFSSTDGVTTAFEGCAITWYTGASGSNNGCAIYTGSTDTLEYSLRMYYGASIEISATEGYEIYGVVMNFTSSISSFEFTNTTYTKNNNSYTLTAPTNSELPIGLKNAATKSNTFTFSDEGIVVTLVPTEA